MNTLFVVLLAIAAASGKNLCSPGSFFRMDCNMCTCSEDGKAMACTDMTCSGQNRNLNNMETTETESKQVCNPRSHFKDFCNTCACADDGLSFACTRMMCDENIWNKDGSLKVTKRDAANDETEVGVRVCEPKTHFKEYCNTCVCSKDGLSKACTIMRCDKNVFNKDGSLKVGIQNLSSGKKQVCKAGSMYRPDNCNVCVCNEDGTDFACSLKICLPTLHPGYGQEEQQPKQSHLYKQGDACTRGRYFYSDCNICVCTNSGTSAYCTMKSCIKGA